MDPLVRFALAFAGAGVFAYLGWVIVCRAYDRWRHAGASSGDVSLSLVGGVAFMICGGFLFLTLVLVSLVQLRSAIFGWI